MHIIIMCIYIYQQDEACVYTYMYIHKQRELFLFWGLVDQVLSCHAFDREAFALASSVIHGNADMSMLRYDTEHPSC